MIDPGQVPVIVVPCYNEERRLDEPALLRLAESGRVSLLLVNDGSTDGTGAVLDRLVHSCVSITQLTLDINAGKAEAVRRGLLTAIRNGAPMVGYYDADLSTPPGELLRLVDALESDHQLSAVFGSRVALLGYRINRSSLRHYSGRVFATAAALALGLPIYDTQCGAKLFRVGPALESALSTPFRSAWGFDVRLCRRLVTGSPHVAGVPPESIEEVPLRSWSDAKGSKLSIRGTMMAFADVILVGIERLQERRGHTHDPDSSSLAEREWSGPE